jgi:excisionase family DNA binding protein
MTDKTIKLHHLGEFLSRTGLSRSTAYREIENGNLRVTRIGRSIRISESEICRYIEAAEAGNRA